MIEKYIYGNPEKSKDIIIKLEKLGGDNIHHLQANNPDCIYYINKHGNINKAHKNGVRGTSICLCFEEIMI